MKKTLFFVYNAKSDIWNKYLDIFHKTMSPTTYSCDLCSLTHGNFSEKKVWKDFRENSDHEFVFMYKDEFLGTISSLERKNLIFPIIFQKHGENIDLLFDSEKLSSLNSVEELIESLKKKIS
ncbi:GTPase [Aquimarina sp. MAR_2010_214]|uniref:GTPase n=1 Tax=Aquimarina sp. MAR_2010_214 TaxID=1250026 RepID=UPI000C71462C|nr:GTPase [Aquimarina sp. MAR_2010_214]